MKLPDLAELQRFVKDTTLQHDLISPEATKIQRKPDGSLVTATDVALQKHLESGLQERWPYPLLGEELTTTEQTDILDTESVIWCLDPIDGTSNFIAGLPYFAVSLALLVEKTPTLALVYDPMRDEVFTAQAGAGVWLNGEALTGNGSDVSLADALALIDFKRLEHDLAARLACEPPYASQRSFGASALDWCWVAAGRCHVYLHGKQKLWDYAAGSLILAEAGGRATTLEGEPVYRHNLTSRSVVAASNRNLFQAWTEWLDRA